MNKLQDSILQLEDTSLNENDLSVINFNVEKSITPLDSMIRSSLNSATIISQTVLSVNEIAKIQPLNGEFSKFNVNIELNDNIIILKKLGRNFAILFNKHRRHFDKNEIPKILEGLLKKLPILKRDMDAELKAIFVKEKLNSKYFPFSRDLSSLDSFPSSHDPSITLLKTKLDIAGSTILESKKKIITMYLEFSIKVLFCLKLLNETIYSTESAINTEVGKELSLLQQDKNNDLRCCSIDPIKLSMFKLLSLSYHRFVVEAQKETTFQDLIKLLTIVKETLDDASNEHVTEFYFNDELVQLDSILNTE